MCSTGRLLMNSSSSVELAIGSALHLRVLYKYISKKEAGFYILLLELVCSLVSTS